MFLAITFLLIGTILLLLEIFLPSAGILSILSGISFVISLVCAFNESQALGFIFLTLTLVAVPIMIIIGMKLFPKTPLGKRMILQPMKDRPETLAYTDATTEDYTHLVGKTGMAASPLRPSGTAEIEGKRYSVVARGELIDKDTRISVIAIEGNSIVVDNLS